MHCLLVDWWLITEANKRKYILIHWSLELREFEESHLLSKYPFSLLTVCISLVNFPELAWLGKFYLNKWGWDLKLVEKNRSCAWPLSQFLPSARCTDHLVHFRGSDYSAFIRAQGFFFLHTARPPSSASPATSCHLTFAIQPRGMRYAAFRAQQEPAPQAHARLLAHPPHPLSASEMFWNPGTYKPHTKYSRHFFGLGSWMTTWTSLLCIAKQSLIGL